MTCQIPDQHVAVPGLGANYLVVWYAFTPDFTSSAEFDSKQENA